jgi:hypothetical protein
VDCTLTLEVGVQYHPLGPITITGVDVDWNRLRVGLAYWQPQERGTNIGVDAAIRRYLERMLVYELEVRHVPPKKRAP